LRLDSQYRSRVLNQAPPINKSCYRYIDLLGLTSNAEVYFMLFLFKVQRTRKRSIVLWHVMLCSPVAVRRRFGMTDCLLLHQATSIYYTKKLFQAVFLNPYVLLLRVSVAFACALNRRSSPQEEETST
jgi:hypothetical protein